MIAAGGTGGHVYPALAVAEALLCPPASGAPDLIFVGTRGGGGFERELVERSGLKFSAFAEVFAGPIAGVNALRAIASVFKISLGFCQSLLLLARHRPAVILMTGGWANVPLALAARLGRVPIVVYLPDIEPGSTIRLLGRFARVVAATVEASKAYFQAGLVRVTGYPLRRSVMGATREAGMAHFRLDPSRRTLLVFGGSRGARSLNLAIEAVLDDILAEGWQVLHITGTLDWERSRSVTHHQSPATGYFAFAYLDEAMGLALASADLAIARAGASTLGEFPHFGVPAILVPYPHAWRYQKTNADYLAERGAGLRLDDELLSTDLLPLIRSLTSEAGRLEAMQRAARALAQPDSAEAIAGILLELGAERR